VITTAKLNMLTFDVPIYVRHINIPPMGKQVCLILHTMFICFFGPTLFTTGRKFWMSISFQKLN